MPVDVTLVWSVLIRLPLKWCRPNGRHNWRGNESISGTRQSRHQSLQRTTELEFTAQPLGNQCWRTRRKERAFPLDCDQSKEEFVSSRARLSVNQRSVKSCVEVANGPRGLAESKRKGARILPDLCRVSTKGVYSISTISLGLIKSPVGVFQECIQIKGCLI